MDIEGRQQIGTVTSDGRLNSFDGTRNLTDMKLNDATIRIGVDYSSW